MSDTAPKMVSVLVPEGSRAWAMAMHDAGEEMEWYDRDLRRWYQGSPHKASASYDQPLKWRLHVAPQPPIVLQPGTPEYRKYLAADALYRALVDVVDSYKAYEASPTGTRAPFENRGSIKDARTALAAYRGEEETK